MTQETARKMLSDHAQAGSPALIPGRIGDHRDKGATPRVKKLRPAHHNLFGKTGHL